ncbi:unnamed protein product, partial [Brenthis ino]
MAFDISWDVNKYKEDHECEEHWLLRKAFIEKWKSDYPEERLICMARVFANMEFMGCRYPVEVMQEVARLSHDIVQNYRKSKKSKLQRTFVSASDAAEDRAKGIKREGGVIKDSSLAKTAKINFVRQGQDESDLDPNSDSEKTNEVTKAIECKTDKPISNIEEEKLSSDISDPYNYLQEMLELECLDYKDFSEEMFNTKYGRMVLLIRPWVNKLSNIQASCQACRLQLSSTYEQNTFSLYIGGRLVGAARADTRAAARALLERDAWDRLRRETVSVLVKQLWVAEGARVCARDVAAPAAAPGLVPAAAAGSDVAVKMMKLMGWKGGGLGADASGIAEPIQPHIQMVSRAGLGSGGGGGGGLQRLRAAGARLMAQFAAGAALDVDLVFSEEFDKAEREALHRAARAAGLLSRSYGDGDRFLVVRRKLDPFSLVRGALRGGGDTRKHRVFLPSALRAAAST